MKTKITLELIEENLRKYLPKNGGKVAQAMEYSLFSGGKRFRPLLLLNTAQAVGNKVTDNALILSAALEYIHTYSLIHDDLPAMDNDELRRGVRTCHMQYGEAAATLAGDALLNLAAEIVFEGKLSDKYYVNACKYLFNKSGINGMIYGQCLDLFAETKSVEDATEVATHKTGDLIRAAIVCGALCGHATEDEVAVFEQIATDFGIAYQIVDDLIDAEKCEKSMLDLFNPRECREYAKKLTANVIALCDSLPQYDLTFIKEYANKNLNRTY